jgi:hypothetical protein
VTDVEGVWFIEKQQSADYVYSYNGTTYTDNTAEAATKTGTPFYAFASTVVANDAIYIGNSNRFMGVNVRLSTFGVAGVVAWEYYNGSAWVALSDITDLTENFEKSGKVNFGLPLDWQTTTVSLGADQYWIRARVTTAHTTSPKIQYLYILDEIESEIEPMDIEFSSEGTLTFLTDTIPSGTQNIRIDYRYGATSVPKLVQDLTTVLAAIRGFVALSGGQYTNMSSYSLGELNVSLGDPSMKINAAVAQLEKLRDGYLPLVGKRVDVVGT